MDYGRKKIDVKKKLHIFFIYVLYSSIILYVTAGYISSPLYLPPPNRSWGSSKNDLLSKNFLTHTPRLD